MVLNTFHSYTTPPAPSPNMSTAYNVLVIVEHLQISLKYRSIKYFEYLSWTMIQYEG